MPRPLYFGAERENRPGEAGVLRTAVPSTGTCPVYALCPKGAVGVPSGCPALVMRCLPCFGRLRHHRSGGGYPVNGSFQSDGERVLPADRRRSTPRGIENWRSRENSVRFVGSRLREKARALVSGQFRVTDEVYYCRGVSSRSSSASECWSLDMIRELPGARR